MNHYILLLSKKEVSLLTFRNHELDEIRDGVFPMTFEDDYEYARASRGNSFGFSLKGFEKDKSITRKQRYQHFLNEVNKKLKHYLTPESNLFIAGTDQDRATFRHISDYNHLVAHEFSGGYQVKRLNKLKHALDEFLTV